MHLAAVETVDNGKAVRETINADLPLIVDHWRYFAGVIRAEEGTATELDADTLSLTIQEPLGVVGQIIPWNFPMLMATWKLCPALAAGNCVVMKPAEQTPTSIMVLMELIGDLLPPGVLNIVSGDGMCGKYVNHSSPFTSHHSPTTPSPSPSPSGAALARSTRVDKIAFTGSTETGAKILKVVAENITPVTMELGGKSPQIFF
jgi:aldehyde dehydrogenase